MNSHQTQNIESGGEKMFVYTMKLYAANPQEPFNFENEENQHIFTKTADFCNNSINFKRTKKEIVITEFQDNCLTVMLKSKAPIESPTLTLRGFSRALVNTGKFKKNLYRSSLFSAREIETTEDNDNDADDISVVQNIIALFMSQSSAYETDKELIRQIISANETDKELMRQIISANETDKEKIRKTIAELYQHE